MRFTAYQYQEAIKRLQDGMKQLEADGNCCSVCGDSGHMAYECGFNPLLAVHFCRSISREANQLHDMLHWLAGYDHAFGVQLGPAKVVVPPRSEEEDPNRCLLQCAPPVNAPASRAKSRRTAGAKRATRTDS
jgi:hypothetical protein